MIGILLKKPIQVLPLEKGELEGDQLPPKYRFSLTYKKSPKG